jgi:hypothetical protein
LGHLQPHARVQWRMPWQSIRPNSAGRRGRSALKDSPCRTASSGSCGSTSGNSHRNLQGPAQRSTRLAELAQPKRVAGRLPPQQRCRRPPPPMGMPLAHYWAIRSARAGWQHGGSTRSRIWCDLEARASQEQHSIECSLHGRAAWDSSPADGIVAKPSGWNNDFGGAGADVLLAAPDPLPQHVVARRGRSCAWDVDLYYPPVPPPPVDPNAVSNRQRSAAMGAWHQVRRMYKG